MKSFPFADAVFVAAFAVILWLPLTLNFISNDDHAQYDPVEKRSLTHSPNIPSQLDSVPSFLKEYDRYFSDRFGARGELIFLNNYFRYHLSQVLESHPSLNDTTKVSISADSLEMLFAQEKQVATKPKSESHKAKIINKYPVTDKATADTSKNKLFSDPERTKWTTKFFGPLLPGKDGWLFYTNPAGGDAMACYWGLNLFSQKELDSIATILERKRNWLQSNKCKYYLLFVPNTVTMYPEFLPDNINRYDGLIRIDQLDQYLASKSKVHFLNLRKPLTKFKRFGRLYSKTDTHWNELGAFIGYRELMKMMNKDGLGIEPLSFSDFELVSEGKSYGDVANLMNLGGVITEKDVIMRPIHPPPYMNDTLNDTELNIVKRYPDWYKEFVRAPRLISKCRYTGEDRKLPKIMVIGDSYRERLMPYIVCNFSYSYNILAYQIDIRLIDFILSVKPDIVVEVHTERFLRILLANLPLEVR